MISTVTTQGLLRFSTHTGSLTGARFIEFRRKLMHDGAEASTWSSTATPPTARS